MIYTKKGELSQAAQSVLRYYLKEEGGKYHYVHSNRAYTQNNAEIEAFAELCEEFEYGNDAPRGGRTGDFIKCIKLNEIGRKLVSEFADAERIAQELAEKDKAERIVRYEKTLADFEEWANTYNEKMSKYIQEWKLTSNKKFRGKASRIVNNATGSTEWNYSIFYQVAEKFM